MDLLTNHEAASRLAGLKGNTHGFEWMLEKINPERFGRSQKGDESNRVIPGVVILTGKYPEGEK